MQPSVSTAAPEAEFVHVDGARLFVKHVGEGPACIVLHGGLGLDHTYMHPWLDPLGRALCLTYVDVRGNGRSDRVALDTLTMDRFVEDVEALRRHLGQDKVLLMGHSYGSCIALEYAARYPSHVAGLLLIGGVAVNDFWEEAMQRLNARDPRMAEEFQRWPDMTDASFRDWLARNAAAYCHDYKPERDAAMWQETIVDVRTWARGNAALSEFDIVDRLDSMQMPALVLHGLTDLVPPSQARILHERLPRARLVLFERSGHFPYFEEPEAFQREVLAWLRDEQLI